MTDSETGYLFDDSDPDSLRQALDRGLDPSASRLGYAARAMVEERYSVSRLAEKYEELYTSLLA